MARAMIASALWNPNPRRMISRIRVLVDSMRALDSPDANAAVIASRWRVMRLLSSTKAGMRQRRAQPIYRSRASIPSVPSMANTVRSPSLSR